MGTAMMEASVEEYKVPMKRKKKTVKQRLRNWLLDGPIMDESSPEINKMPIGISRSIDSPREFDAEGLNITIHNANGGYVASFRRYDRKTDRHSNQLYVITSDQKFEEALAQCIAMECLSR